MPESAMCPASRMPEMAKRSKQIVDRTKTEDVLFIRKKKIE